MSLVSSSAHLSTRAVHIDGHLSGPEVAASIRQAPPFSLFSSSLTDVLDLCSTTTTFRHPTLAQIEAAEPGYYDKNWDPHMPSRHMYSRETQPTATRVEEVLSDLIGGPTILYSSGIAACWAVLLHFRPDVIAVTGGYFGCHGSFEVYQRTRGKDQVSIIALEDEYPKDKKVLVWLETPVNPTGESRSIEAYSKKAKAVGATLAVDATFAPPPLQDPFMWGADIVMHSGTKYFGGHSDLLIGTVTVKDKTAWHELWDDRVHVGAAPGSLDTWLLLRSLRTLNLRVHRQATSATALAKWLHSFIDAPAESGLAGVVKEVWHTCLQEDAAELVGEGKQLSTGPACFGILLHTPEQATKFPEELQYFIHATSLGGVESLIEQRVISDPKCDPRLLRISVGIEELEDLKADMEQALKKVVELGKTQK
ncbi:hypothetical protein JCM8547_009402 [Rhodosporidiobolus lusitaniae]